MKQWKTINKVKSPKSKVKTEEIVKLLLDNRGVRTKKEIEEFFNPKLAKVTIDAVGINKKELKKTVKRINLAIKNNEKIIIFGDYDTDGICGTAILWETIYRIYKNVFPYIPNRKGEGYGLTIEGIKNVLSQYPDVKLIITVDNGIVANKAVDFANKNKINTIITDHHQKSKKQPKALAIVQTDKICGAGVAYLLAQKIENRRLKVEGENGKFLELVALATVADMVPLLGSNRTLVKFGLEVLRKTKRIGLLEIFKEAGISKEEIGVYEIGHIIAPRLNATGRISHAMDSLRLVCTNDKEKAKEYAKVLGETNRERQQITEETTIHAKSIYIEEKYTSKIVFVSNEEYDQGVIGLVASRLVDEYYKPSFVISIGEKFSKGSARSVKGVNIIELIRSLSSHLVEAGGHPMAAGFTVETDRIEEFKKALEKKANETINEELLKRTLIIDLPISFENISFELDEALQKFSPFGVGNPEPTFLTKGVQIEDLRAVGADGKHLKFYLKSQLFGFAQAFGSEVFDRESQTESAAQARRGEISNLKFDAIAFGMGERVKEIHIGDKVDLVYTIEEDTWDGNRRLQLKVKDFRRQS